jgi:hypothetical protein
MIHFSSSTATKAAEDGELDCDRPKDRGQQERVGPGAQGEEALAL